MMSPSFAVRDLAEAVAFYVEVLDLQRVSATPEIASFYAILTRGDDELHLSHSSRPERGRQTAIVACDDVDALFASFRARGLQVPPRPNSPVHEGPLDQTWGTREVYIDDPSGNTLCFQQR